MATVKQKRESALLDKLSRDHGYLLIELPKGQQVTLAMDGKTKKIATYRVMKLVVPWDSALAKAMNDETKRLAKADKKRKAQ